MNKMLIHFDGEEVSIAVCDEGRLTELYLPQIGKGRLLGAIYKGRVINVLPGMQAAFVDIGLEKNSFLHAEDVYIPSRHYGDASQADREKLPNRKIESLLEQGQDVLVQVFKEPQGEKGARVTMHLSLPGRYAVLLPTSAHVAVSRRIEKEPERERLRERMKELTGGKGVIIRTAASGMSVEELAEDFRSLNKLWKTLQGKAVKSKAPSLIYRERDMLRRVIRDTVAADVACILVENAEAAEKIRRIMAEVAPKLDCEIRICAGEDLFSAYAVEEQLEKALRRRLWLKSGGYIMFDQTEALTVVDVNTGKFVGSSNFNDTALTTNLEAAKEIARQIRLRNTGGIIIIDFINMEQEQDRKTLLAELAKELKKDRTRVAMMGITNLGLVELTRKKIGHELSYSLEEECPFCRGKGRVLRADIAARRLLKELEREAQSSTAHTMQVMASAAVAAHLLGPDGEDLQALERRLGKRIRLIAEEGRCPEEIVVRGVFDV